MHSPIASANRVPLPIDEFLSGLGPSLKKHPHIVVIADPGTGKTTRLPAALSQIVEGEVWVLEPRRVAAIAAATRVADENAWKLGNEVGYQVRFESRVSKETKITYMTEALFLRKLVSNPELKGVSAVVLDEFHERSLHADLSLGFLKELSAMGSPVHIVVMSATLQADQACEFLDDAPLLRVPGKLYPLTIHHQKTQQHLRTDREFYEQIVQTVQMAAQSSTRSVLAFLPGVGEIERLRDQLESWARTQKIDLVPLHGQLNPDDQRKVLLPSSTKRVILATNVAEASVTVPDIDTVVDSGLAKTMQMDLNTGFSRLRLGRISMSSASQRSGRAGRLGPGQVYRMWSKPEEASMPQADIPEVARVDLSDAVLFLSAQGISTAESFSWIEVPPSPSLRRAQSFLRNLGALNETLQITSLGEEMAKLPLSPRHAKLLISSRQFNAESMACDMIALLDENDFLSEEASKDHVADQWECDLALRMHLLQSPPSSNDSFGVKRRSLERIRWVSGRLKQSLKVAPGNNRSVDEDLIRQLLFLSHPDRVCRRRQQSHRGIMAGGRGIALEPSSVVAKSPYFVALRGRESGQNSDTKIDLASGLSLEQIKEWGASLIRTEDKVEVDEKSGRVFRARQSVYVDLPLGEPQVEPAAEGDVQSHLVALACARFSEIEAANAKLASWMRRWSFFAKHRPPQPRFQDEDLRPVMEQICFGEKSLQSLFQKDLIPYFENQLTRETVQQFHRDVPESLIVPSGSRITVHYPEGRDPYVEVRIQEIFGWLKPPRILSGEVSLIFHLLGPNYRPVQVTSDLESFWRQGYFEVRKDLRSRYPKHSWPEDPLTAKPEAKGRPRK